MTDLIKSDNWDLYDPQWEQVFDHHMEEMKKLQAADPDADTSSHEKGWKDAWVSQFKNATEYADYMLKTLKSYSKMYHLSWVHVDTSALKTREEAIALFNEVNNFVDDQRKLTHGSLPITKNSNLFSQECTKSMYLTIGHGLNQTRTIVTAEEKGDGMNICLSHLKNSGRSVYNAIEYIATTLYAHTLKDKVSNPKKINWYIHGDATVQPGREAFIHIPMDYSNGQFQNPQFNRLEEVPMAIKLAEFNCAEDEITVDNTQQASSQQQLDTPKKKFLGLSW